LYESWNGSMERGLKSAMVKHVGKGVIVVDSERQMCKWVHMAKILQWECDGKIPITILANTFKYIEINWNTSKYTINIL
jgi:hypothetical protein